MPDPILDDRCPAVGCGDASSCGGALAGALPRQGAERTAMRVLRFIAAARDTGDACCWDAAFEEAEAAFGDRAGSLVVACAGALIRRLQRTGSTVRFLPPACRRLSGDEVVLLAALGRRLRAVPSRLDRGPAADALAAFAAAIAPSTASRARHAA